MAKKTRIPELVVGKIFIDGGDKDKVYTIGSDEDGALRIGDSRSNMVATIDQKTGKIVAGSFAGDGTELQGISAEGLEELMTAKLLTLSADKLFFNFDADGVAKVTTPAQKITLTAKTQNIDSPTYKWYVDSVLDTSTGAVKEISLTDFGDNESISVTVEIDDESLSESITIFKLQEGRTGRDAVTVAMSNPTVVYQASLADGDTPDIDEEDDGLMEAGKTNFVVRYGSTKLTPVILAAGETLQDNQFTVVTTGQEYVTIPDAQERVYISADVPNDKMDVSYPKNVTAAVGTVTFLVTAKVDGQSYEFTEIQTFTLSTPGATGENAKFVKLTADDYQVGYDGDGVSPDPGTVTLTAKSQNHGATTYYRWFVNDVPWQPGIDGAPSSAWDFGTESTHLYAAAVDTLVGGQIILSAGSSYTEFGGRKTVRVETQTTDSGDPIASDSVSIIATKDGSNAIQITADNLTHGFPADSDGIIDGADYEDGACTFQVYHGNDNFTANMDVCEKLKDLIESMDPDESPSQADITNILNGTTYNGISLDKQEFAVLANAISFPLDIGNNVTQATNTINPYDISSPASTSDDTGDGIKFTPRDMHSSIRRAAINYSFFLKTNDGVLAATTVRTQTFLKGRDGPQGPTGEGEPGTDAVSVKLLLDDYQIAFDENGGNPQTLNGDETSSAPVTATITTQGTDTLFTFFRVFVDDELQPVQNPELPVENQLWEANNYQWRRIVGDSGTYTFDWSNSTYGVVPGIATNWANKKKVIKVEVAEINYTLEPNGPGTGDDVYALAAETLSGETQTLAGLSVLASDSESIIATKEGSNAVEVIASNLSHQFIQDSDGDIDYSEGGISFGVFIGNDELDAFNGEDLTAAGAKSFRVYAKSETNIVSSTTKTVSGKSYSFDPPSTFAPGTAAASITWAIQVKDATGTVRPEREFVQTFTKARDGSDSKLIRLDASSTIFSFDDALDQAATPAEITFYTTSQNLSNTEAVTVNDITFKDKNGDDITSDVLDYTNPDGTITRDVIGTSITNNGYFSLRFTQFQGAAKDDDGAPLSPGMYQDSNGNTIEYNRAVIEQLKRTVFPITVKLTKTGLSGPVANMSDELRVLLLFGGTDTINIDAPNAVHLFPASSDLEVDNSVEALAQAGTPIDVYVGTAPVEYDADATDADSLGIDKYRFGDIVYNTPIGDAIGDNPPDNMVTVTVDSNGLTVTSVEDSYKKQVLTLPVQVNRRGTVDTKDLVLSYSKIKEGRDGLNAARNNFDFSNGITGWSFSSAAEPGVDMTQADFTTKSDVVPVIPDVKSEEGQEYIKSRTPAHGDKSGHFKNIRMNEDIVWTKYPIPYPSTLQGGFKVKFRAKANDSNSGATGKVFSNTQTRVQLYLKGYNTAGESYNTSLDAQGRIETTDQGTSYDPDARPKVCAIKFPAWQQRSSLVTGTDQIKGHDETESLFFESGGYSESNYGADDLVLIYPPGATDENGNPLQNLSTDGEPDTYIPLRTEIYDEYEFLFSADVLNKFFADIAIFKAGFRVSQLNQDTADTDGIIIDNFSIEYVEDYTTFVSALHVATPAYEIISNGNFQNEDNGLPSDVLFGIYDGTFHVSDAAIEGYTDGAKRGTYTTQKAKSTKALKTRQYPISHRGKEIFTKVGEGVDSSPVLRFRDGGHYSIDYTTWSNAMNTSITETIDNVHPRYAAVFKKVTLPTETKKIRVRFRYKIEQTSGEIDAKGPKLFLWFDSSTNDSVKYITSNSDYWMWGKDSQGNKNSAQGSQYGSGVYLKVNLKYGNTWYEEAIDIDPATGEWYYLEHDGTETGPHSINQWNQNNLYGFAYNTQTRKQFSVNVYSAQDTNNGNNTGDLHLDYIKAEQIEPENLGEWDPDAAAGAEKGTKAHNGLKGATVTSDNDGKLSFSYDDDDFDDVVSDFKADNDRAFDPGTPGEQVKERADSGAGASTMIDGVTFDVNNDGTMTFSFGADTINGVGVGSTPTLSPTTIVSNNAITIGNDGALSGIGTAGIKVNNENAFDDGDGLGVKNDATDGKTAHTGLVDGSFTEEDGFLKLNLGGGLGTKTSPHPTDIRKTGKNNFIATGGITIVGTTAEKTGGNSGWGSDQISSKDGYIGGAYASAVYAGGSLMFGLNTDPLANSTWSSIDYAWYINGGTAETIYESGSSKGNHNVTSGDVLSVTYDGHSIRYLINGEVARTVEVSITSKLFFDSAFSNIGAKIENIDFGPMSDTSKGHEVRGFFGDEAAPLIKVTNAPTDLKNANAFDSGTPGAQVKVRADSGAGANSMIDGATFDVNADGTMTLNFGADTINNIGVGSTPTLNPTTKVSNGAISISNGTISGIGTGAGTKVSNSLVYSDMNALDTSHMNFDFDTADTWRMWQDSWANSYANVGTDTAFTVADSGEALYGNKVATLAVGKQDHVRRWYSEEFVFPADTSILSKSTFTFTLRAKGPGTGLFRWFITLFSEGRNGANSLYFDFDPTVAEEDGINSNNGSIHSGPRNFTMKSGHWCTFVIEVPYSRMISEYSSARGFRIAFEKDHATVNNTVVDHCGFTISNPAARGPSTKGLFGAVGLTTGKVNTDIGNIGVSINSSGKISLKKDGSGGGDVTVDKSKVGLSKVPNYNIDQVRDSVGSYLGSSNGFLSGIAGNLNISNGSLAVASSLDSVSLGAELGLGGGWVPPNIPGMNFTGKHPCLLAGEIPDTEICGFIVSSTGVYQNQTEELSENTPTIDEALPVVKLSDEEKEKACFGVISKHLEEGKYEINSVGEGAMWVANTAGDLENGDYICSSNIPGYGMKQDDDILRNYTVAKITQDCLFDLDSEDYDCKEVEHDGIIYKVAFVGCTYHCG
jgi:hypothetical protein